MAETGLNKSPKCCVDTILGKNKKIFDLVTELELDRKKERKIAKKADHRRKRDTENGCERHKLFREKH